MQYGELGLDFQNLYKILVVVVCINIFSFRRIEIGGFLKFVSLVSFGKIILVESSLFIERRKRNIWVVKISQFRDYFGVVMDFGVFIFDYDLDFKRDI